MAIIKTLFSGNNLLTINITGVYNVIDETNVIVVNRSDLIGPDGSNIPKRIKVEEITWAVGADFDYLTLEFDDATDEVIEQLQGQGYMDYKPFGGKSMLGDPISDTEGDILLSTSGGAAGGTYSILLVMRLKT